MFEMIHGYIETWGTGGASFRNLYKRFLEELLSSPKLREGPKAWHNEEFRIIEEILPIIRDSAKNWTLLADSLKQSAEEYKSECLAHVDLSELQVIALKILQQEESLFKKLSKIKI